MQPGDIYTWLTAGPDRGCDGFDTHVLASILALSIFEAEAGRFGVPDAVGVDGQTLAELADYVFPHAVGVLSSWRYLSCSAPTPDESCLRNLLAQNTTCGTRLELLLADIVARRCMRPNHLWQDLGFRNRRELGWMMLRHFESLAVRNKSDMKWKKFLYRTICRDEGFMLCAAPSCSECDDFEDCFGDESGESLLAKSRKAVDIAR